MGLVSPVGLKAQILTWDNDPATPGLQNGSGTWNTTTSNWLDATNNNGVWANTGAETAQFGSTTTATANTVSLSTSMNVKGINFLALGTATPVSGRQYTLNGASAGTVLNFGEGGLIQLADYSSGGSQFVTFGSNLTLQGNNLTIQKSSGTVTQFVNLLMASNADLKGNLTVGSYVYVGVSGASALSALSAITINSGGTLAFAASNVTHTMPVTAAGYANTYGAIRVTGSNVNFAGGIVLSDDAGILMHSSNTGLLINSPITDGGAGHDLHRFSLTKTDGTMTLTAANTYGGKTVLGRTTSGYTGGVTILDFNAAGAPASDILYHDLATPGGLDMIGSTLASSVLRLNGLNGETSAQRLGNVSAQGTRSVIELISGANGTMNLSLGSIGRTGTGMMAFMAPAQGQITTTMDDAVLGPWATFKAADGRTTWAQVANHTVTGFNGSTPYVTGVAPVIDAASHLAIDGASLGSVMPAGPLAHLATISMNDAKMNRAVVIGSGSTLRLGVAGGVQVTSDAKSLTIGQAGVTSYLSAGGDAAGTGQIILTNNSTSSLLTVHSGITNNAGGGVVSVLVNGVAGSTTVLAGAGAQTGGTVIASGGLELRHGLALGTAGTVNVLEGATLGLSGGISFSRPVTLASKGAGAATDGKLRAVHRMTRGTAAAIPLPSLVRPSAAADHHADRDDPLGPAFPSPVVFLVVSVLVMDVRGQLVRLHAKQGL